MGSLLETLTVLMLQWSKLSRIIFHNVLRKYIFVNCLYVSVLYGLYLICEYYLQKDIQLKCLCLGERVIIHTHLLMFTVKTPALFATFEFPSSNLQFLGMYCLCLCNDLDYLKIEV
jgi:hypothetical protein